MRNRFHLPFAAGLAAALALCPMPAKAQQRTVNFFNWSNYMAPGVLEDFTKETGIKVVYDTFDANETLETRLLAGKSGYDVVVPSGYFLQLRLVEFCENLRGDLALQEIAGGNDDVVA